MSLATTSMIQHALIFQADLVLVMLLTLVRNYRFYNAANFREIGMTFGVYIIFNPQFRLYSMPSTIE